MISQRCYDELVKFREESLSVDQDKETVEFLIVHKYIQAAEHERIEQSSGNSTFVNYRVKCWKITELGKNELEQFEEKRAEATKKERQQRFENKISVLNLLVPLVTFLLGLLVEHFSGVIDRLFSFQ